MLPVLDVVYTIIHLFIILFNLFGWVWPRTRKAHFFFAMLTLGSWFILGIWYGWGYCPVTDWQWDVKQQLGETNLPPSFIEYYGEKILSTQLNRTMVDTVTLVCFIIAIILSIYFNFFHRRKQRAL